MGGALDERGPIGVRLLEPLELIRKLPVNRQGRRIPTRIGREAIVKHVEATQFVDVEALGKPASQLRCGEQVKEHLW